MKSNMHREVQLPELLGYKIEVIESKNLVSITLLSKHVQYNAEPDNLLFKRCNKFHCLVHKDEVQSLQ